jgi:RsiW-degrading membrane proteinase PrsW (M82 family)
MSDAVSTVPPSPQQHTHPTTRRAIVLAIIMGILAVLGLCAVVLTAGVVGAAVSVLAATLPALLVAVIALLFDRYEPEPRGVLALTFAFGATGAVLIAMVGEGVATTALRASSGQIVAAAGIAPVIEEIAKGVAVLAVMLRLRDEFNGIVDGIIYAVMVGCGFAFAENIVYYVSSIVQGQSTFAATVITRGGFSAFAHPLFTSMTGIGLAYGLEHRGKMRYVAPVLGLLGAMTLHGIWNAGTYLGGGFIWVYLGIFIPMLAGAVAITGFAARHEGKVLGTYLAPDVRAGLLTPEELAEMTSLQRRRAMLRYATQVGGKPARNARREFHHAMAQLAFSRYRARPNPPDPNVEMGWVREIARYKQWVDPAWTAPEGVGEF